MHVSVGRGLRVSTARSTKMIADLSIAMKEIVWMELIRSGVSAILDTQESFALWTSMSVPQIHVCMACVDKIKETAIGANVVQGIKEKIVMKMLMSVL